MWEIVKFYSVSAWGEDSYFTSDTLWLSDECSALRAKQLDRVRLGARMFLGALQCCIRSNGRTVQSEIQTSHKIYALYCREMWNAESFDDASSASEASTHTVWGASVSLFSLLFSVTTIATTSDRICTSVAVTLQQTLLIYKPLG